MFKKILSLFRKDSPESVAPSTEARPAVETAVSDAPRKPSQTGPRDRRRKRGRGPEGSGKAEVAPQNSAVGTAGPERQAAADAESPRKRRRRKKRRGGSDAGPAAPVDGVLTGPQPRDAWFGDMAVSAPVARALAEMGYVAPTPIQEQVIGPMLAGEDLVGQAQTGTGKTASFGIPLAEAVDGSLDYTQAIVLVPTRELARQVTDELGRIMKYRGIRIVAVYGGAPIGRQISALQAGAHVVVGTPGRVIDLLDRGALVLDQVRTVVLDEADQMLDIGFLPDIRRILRSTPRSRQTALFSATVPTMIRRLIYSYLREPRWVRVGEESEPVETVRQFYVEVARRDKLDALLEILQTTEAGEQALIFRRTQEDVDWLVKELKRKGFPAEAIHGGLPQGERNAVMQGFRDGKVKLLVSTNLTSRGIDVPTVSHVINYDIPEQVEEYVHRIGRTARMGRTGTAITFVSEWDLEFFDAIRDHVGADNLQEMKISLYQQSGDAAVG